MSYSKPGLYTIFITVLLYIPLAGLLANELHSWTDTERALIKRLWIKSLPQKTDSSNQVVNHSDAIKLGHRLFFDTRLSRNGKVSCASCHQPDKFFSDGLTTGKGLQTVSRNTPTIIGASQHTWFFHDGRADSLWSQALGPLENDLEHGSNRTHVVHTVYHDNTSRSLYEKVFGKFPDISNVQRFPLQAGPVTETIAAQNWQRMSKVDQDLVSGIYANLGKAIAAYETRLQPAVSRFDHYADGVVNNKSELLKSLNKNETEGLRIFLSKAKCITCHSGPMFTDEGFHNISVQPANGKQHDIGRFKGAREVLKNEFNCRSMFNDEKNASCSELEYMVMERHETQGAMKTPSLRNVAKTAPYMHAGQYKTLKRVIRHYKEPPPVRFRQSELFLAVKLTDKEIEQLISFLKSLNSSINAPAQLLSNPFD